MAYTNRGGGGATPFAADGEEGQPLKKKRVIPPRKKKPLGSEMTISIRFTAGRRKDSWGAFWVDKGGILSTTNRIGESWDGKTVERACEKAKRGRNRALRGRGGENVAAGGERGPGSPPLTRERLSTGTSSDDRSLQRRGERKPCITIRKTNGVPFSGDERINADQLEK